MSICKDDIVYHKIHRNQIIENIHISLVVEGKLLHIHSTPVMEV